MDGRLDGLIGLLRGMGSEGPLAAADAIERLRSEVDGWRRTAESWSPIPEDMLLLSQVIGRAIGRQDVTIPRMLALRLYQTLEGGRRAVGVWKDEASRINAALTGELERLERDREQLARECRHALLAALGYIAGWSVLDRAGVEATIVRALKSPGMPPLADLPASPPGPPDPPRPKCARCGHPYDSHVNGGLCGGSPHCECQNYLFPEVA